MPPMLRMQGVNARVQVGVPLNTLGHFDLAVVQV